MKIIINNWHCLAYKFLSILLVIQIANCYPVTKLDLPGNPEQKNEKRYPNGTVVGKYFYKDSEGNPVHVKYYADQSRYGVELKSIKIFDSTSTATPKSDDAPEKLEYLMNTAPPVDIAADFYNPTPFKYKNTYPYEILNKDLETGNVQTSHNFKTNSDYEIYVKNDLKAPKKCGKEKVQVYFEKNKRKARKAMSNLDVSKYCE